MNTRSPDAVTSDQTPHLREDLIAALRTIYAPGIPVNIYDRGLIYALEIDPPGRVAIGMTLTAPGCPVADTFPGSVEERLRQVPGVSEVHVTLVGEPPWSMALMPDLAKLQLGLL